MIGFRKVIDFLSSSGKPVVGHNMFLDLCHCFHHFHRDLPNEYQDFKQSAAKLFPNLFDTKYLCSNAPSFQEYVKNTALDHVYSVVSTDPFKHPKIGLLSYTFNPTV